MTDLEIIRTVKVIARVMDRGDSWADLPVLMDLLQELGIHEHSAVKENFGAEAIKRTLPSRCKLIRMIVCSASDSTWAAGSNEDREFMKMLASMCGNPNYYDTFNIRPRVGRQDEWQRQVSRP